MNEMNGEETAVRVRQLDNNVIMVFYTGFAEPSPVVLKYSHIGIL